MITALISTLNDAETLPRLLGALVPASVNGLILDVIICDGGSIDATLEIAHDAGATITDDDALDEVIVASRGSWLLILPPGARLTAQWMATVGRYLEDNRDAPAQIGSPRKGWFLGRRQPVGWLIPKSLAEALDLADWGQGGLRHLAGRKVQRLDLFAGD